MNISLQNVDKVSALLTVNIEKADYQEKVEKVLKTYRQKANIPGFRKGMVPMSLIKKQFGKAVLAEEVDKLIELQEKHKEYYQLTLFEHERKLKEQERRVDELFDQFMSWVKETLTIQNNPYIRVVSVLMGVSQ